VIRSPLFIGSTSERERATRAGIARMCVGGSLLVTTGLASRVFGAPAGHDNATTRLLARLFGIRNIVLGFWALAARDQGAAERKLCYQVNAAVDAADLAVLAIAFVRASEMRRAVVMSSALGGSALPAWLELAREAGTATAEA
jgi:hypothetical protein